MPRKSARTSEQSKAGAYAPLYGLDEEDIIASNGDDQVADETVREFDAFPASVPQAQVNHDGPVYCFGRVYLDLQAMLREPGLEPLDKEGNSQGGDKGEKETEEEFFTHAGSSELGQINRNSTTEMHLIDIKELYVDLSQRKRIPEICPPESFTGNNRIDPCGPATMPEGV